MKICQMFVLVMRFYPNTLKNINHAIKEDNIILLKSVIIFIIFHPGHIYYKYTVSFTANRIGGSFSLFIRH